MKEEPCWMDPRRGVDMIASQLHFMAFEGLYRLQPDLTLSPGAALSHDISDDRMTYTYHLRDSSWSNGEKLTAYDFEKTWKTLLDPSFPCRDAYLIYMIRNAKLAKEGEVSLDKVGIHALDEKTFSVELERPFPSFLQITALSFLAPVNEMEDETFIGNGPFILQRWDHNHEMIFSKNPHYWRYDEIDLDEIQVHMISNEMSALHAYEKGDFDFLGAPLSPFPVATAHSLVQQRKLNSTQIAGTKIISFNHSKFPLNNAHIRKALSLSIDRKSIVDNITGLGQTIGTRAIPPVLDPKREISFISDASPEEATRELEMGLHELGLDSLPQLTLIYWGSTLNNLIVQQITEKWRKDLGVDVVLEKADFKMLLSSTQEGSYEISLLAYLAEFPDSINIFERYSDKENSRNYSKWENKEYALLFKASQMASANEIQGYKDQMEQILMDEAPFAPIYHYQYSFMIKPHVKNFAISPLGHILFDQIKLEEMEHSLGEISSLQ